MSRHKFKIGQLVYYRAESASGTYQITQLLPPEGDEYQYRIKSVREPHERVAKEHALGAWLQVGDERFSSDDI